MQNMFVLFEKKPVITEKIGAPNLIVSPTQSAIEFDNVTFGYTPDKMVDTSIYSQNRFFYLFSQKFEHIMHAVVEILSSPHRQIVGAKGLKFAPALSHMNVFFCISGKNEHFRLYSNNRLQYLYLRRLF